MLVKRQRYKTRIEIMVLFAPEFPKISVKPIDKKMLASLAEQWSMGLPYDRPDHHIKVAGTERGAPHGMCDVVKKEVVYSPRDRDMLDPEFVTAFAVGDYLVISDNGSRFITRDESVMEGDLSSLPAEMFRPVKGKPVSF
jgi:hypothetical protein